MPKTFATSRSTSGGGTTVNITNNYNTKKVDQTGGGTTTYGALGGLVNSSNTVYTVSNGSYVTGTLEVELNGQEQTLGSTGDYTETTPGSGTFTFAIAPPTGSIIIASYITQNSTSGNVPQNYQTKTTTYAMNSTTDYGILANATSGAFNLTPPLSTLSGIEVIIKKTDSSANAVTVVGTIDGATNYNLGTQYKYVRLVTTTVSGTYYVIGNN